MSKSGLLQERSPIQRPLLFHVHVCVSFPFPLSPCRGLLSLLFEPELGTESEKESPFPPSPPFFHRPTASISGSMKVIIVARPNRTGARMGGKSGDPFSHLRSLVRSSKCPPTHSFLTCTFVKRMHLAGLGSIRARSESSEAWCALAPPPIDAGVSEQSIFGAWGGDREPEHGRSPQLKGEEESQLDFDRRKSMKERRRGKRGRPTSEGRGRGREPLAQKGQRRVDAFLPSLSFHSKQTQHMGCSSGGGGGMRPADNGRIYIHT